jgi:hypothetical protein
MFMRFRGGGVGHIGTRYLDSRMKDDNNESSHEHQEDSEERIADLYEDSDSYPQEERGDGVEDNEEHISRRKPSNEETEDEDDKGEDENENESEDGEQEVPGNMNDEQDFEDDLEDEEIMDDDEILDEEGYAEL